MTAWSDVQRAAENAAAGRMTAYDLLGVVARHLSEERVNAARESARKARAEWEQSHRWVMEPDTVELPRTVGDLRRAIDGMPDGAQMIVNVSGHGEDYAVELVMPSVQIPAGAQWDEDERTVGLEIHLGKFREEGR